MKRFAKATVILAVLLLGAAAASGFGEVMGACEGDCSKCHYIDLEEASSLVRQLNPQVEVLEVRDSPVRGLWELVVRAGGTTGLAYVDFSKQHVITGSIIEVRSRRNVTERRIYDLSKVDVAAIPLDDALVMGHAAEARYRAIVFDDPD